ncbi:MAG: YCF48-related protein [Saprospiraceae bacterium]|nr:YCF48-related protein [Saprospiraceae bacterium]
MKHNSSFQIIRSLLYFLLCILCAPAQAQIWTAQASGTTSHLLGIHFVDNNTGYAVGGSGVILKTINGGTNWVQQTSSNGNTLYATCFTDAAHGVAVGDGSTILHTADGGATWVPVASPVFAEMRAVWFLNASVGFITGGLPGVSTILKTTDGGLSWADISPAYPQAVYSVFFTDPNTGYASNFDGFVLKTVDGGATWISNFVSNNHLFGIFFTDANHGYCVGGDWNNNTTVILKTNDAGNTWIATNNPDPSANYLLDVEFVNANLGYAIGGNVQNNTGNILKTTDAGLTWTPETSNPSITSRLYRLSLPSSSAGYACGLDGTILKLESASPPEEACDIKVNGCVKYELLTITEDAGKNRTYRIRVTNNCVNKLRYFVVQVPNGLQATSPANNSTYVSDGGKPYLVRNPNFSPFYSLRYSPTTDSIANGQSDIFEYTLPAQAVPTFIHVAVRLDPQVFNEAHLNTFYCPIGQTPIALIPQKFKAVAFQKTMNTSFILFPNPNAGTFSVELPEPAKNGTKFQVTDLAGRLLQEQNTEPGRTQQTIRAGELPSGLYFLQVISEGRVIAIDKFMKQ